MGSSKAFKKKKANLATLKVRAIYWNKTDQKLQIFRPQEVVEVVKIEVLAFLQ